MKDEEALPRWNPGTQGHWDVSLFLTFSQHVVLTISMSWGKRQQ